MELDKEATYIKHYQENTQLNTKDIYINWIRNLRDYVMDFWPNLRRPVHATHPTS